MKRYSILILSVIYSLLSFAQTSFVYLSDEDVEEIEQRYVYLHKEFQASLKMIGNTKLPSETRRKAIDRCLNFFINKGDRTDSLTQSCICIINGEEIKKRTIRSFLDELYAQGVYYYDRYEMIVNDIAIQSREIEEFQKGLYRIKIRGKVKIKRKQNGEYSEYYNHKYSESYLYIKKIKVGEEYFYSPLLNNVIFEKRNK